MKNFKNVAQAQAHLEARGYSVTEVHGCIVRLKTAEYEYVKQVKNKLGETTDLTLKKCDEAIIVSEYGPDKPCYVSHRTDSCVLQSMYR